MSTVPQPSGTVTLVFTDIEGSTRLLDSLGADGYRDALAEHRRALRAAFARHGGYEVDFEGDAFFYAFETAGEAVQAVEDALGALEGGPIRIRVGVHTGEPILDTPKYVGLDVHRAARIMASAHGGQAIISRTTRDLLDEGVAVRDLGDHRLKDLSAPQRLYQLGTREFPRPRTLHRTNLPVPATEFLGRVRELDDVVERLRDGVRLLTLTGPGGTGKTRLALQAAAETADEFDAGVWWVPLATLRDPALVLRQTAQTLSVIEQADRPLEDVLAEVLNGKRMLLLLDNAEHLLPDAAGAIAKLRDLDGPKLVVTSRERLQLAGEHVYPVPQLHAPEGVELFEARAGAIEPSFAVTPAVEELCARLDNLPLAIELAAARTSLLRPEQILNRLGNRLDLLKGGRDADPRQQTLRATIAWSYELLTPLERELFASFAVFAGGASLDAVEDVCETDLETLASLLDKSLVRRDGDRYWMLETIREFGIEQLDDVRRADAVERHGAFFDRFAAEADTGLRGPEAAAWLDRVEVELPNLRAAMARSLELGNGRRALRIATGVGRYWGSRSGAAEGRSWLERSLREATVPAVEHAYGMAFAGWLAFSQGDLAAGEELFRRGLAEAESTGDVGIEALALAFLAWVLREQGEGHAGRPALERSRELLAGVSDPWQRSEILLPLAAALVDPDPAERRTMNEEAVALKRQCGDVLGVMDVVNNLGWFALEDGHDDQAVVLLQEALAIASRLRDTYRIALASCNVGLAAVVQGRYAESVEALQSALGICIQRADRRVGSEAVLGLAAATAGLGDDELSVQLYAIARDLMVDAGIVYTPAFLPRLERPAHEARERLGAGRTAELELEMGSASLTRALELVDAAQITSIASPNE
jgi:predicted ATPase/class 3 adenylate cyclase